MAEPHIFVLQIGRPLAEPPIFSHQQFMEEQDIPSDSRLRRLFVKDIAMGHVWGDKFTEHHLLHHYMTWAIQLASARHMPEEQQQFYMSLDDDIIIHTRSGTRAATTRLLFIRL